MSNTAFYWILAQDQLPTIGSGVRRVAVKPVDGDYTLTVIDAVGLSETSIRLDAWENIPHVEDIGQPFIATLSALRSYETRIERMAKERKSNG